MNIQMFQAICLKVANEKDPRKLELLKERLRLLLLSEEPPAHGDRDLDPCKPN
jgi:hypothetical protein